MSKYDQKIMDIYVKGKKVGCLFRKMSAEEYAEDYWRLMEIKKLFKEQIENSKNVFKTPIIEN